MYLSVVEMVVAGIMEGNFPLANTYIHYHRQHLRFMQLFLIFLKSSKFC